jgi:hypothetical protein
MSKYDDMDQFGYTPSDREDLRNHYLCIFENYFRGYISIEKISKFLIDNGDELDYYDDWEFVMKLNRLKDMNIDFVIKSMKPIKKN